MDDKIENFVQDNNKYTCKVDGTKQYDVQIIFSAEKPDEIEQASCTCAYYIKQNKYCKHIYALLYKVKCSENQAKINEKFEELSIETANLISATSDKFTENITNYNLNVLKKFLKYANYAMERLTDMHNYYIQLKTEYAKLTRLLCLMDFSDNVRAMVKKYIEESQNPAYADNDYDEDIDDDLDDDDFDEEDEEEDSKIRLLNELAIDKMAKNLFNNNGNKKENF